MVNSIPLAVRSPTKVEPTNPKTDESARRGFYGTCLVLSELVRWPKPAYDAFLGYGNMPDWDLWVQNPANDKSAVVNVKTCTGGRYPELWLGSNWERRKRWVGDERFYVLADIRKHIQDGSKPDFYVLPSRTVIDTVEKADRAWTAK